MAWKGLLLAGFNRREGMAVDLYAQNGCTWLEAMTACYPTLGLSEMARLWRQVNMSQPTLAQEFGTGLFAEMGLRRCERLEETLRALLATPVEFQTWVDDKKVGARELAPLLALPSVATLAPFLSALVAFSFSKSQAIQCLEWVVELLLLGRPLNDLLPSTDNGEAYLRRLESWRKPRAMATDEEWRKTVTEWPWPAQVQGHWQRFGDQVGLEIKIRTTSPQDFDKKLERLLSIRDTWSCGN